MGRRGPQNAKPKRGRRDPEAGITAAARQSSRPRTQCQRQRRKQERTPRIPRAGLRGEARQSPQPESPVDARPSAPIGNRRRGGGVARGDQAPAAGPGQLRPRPPRPLPGPGGRRRRAPGTGRAGCAPRPAPLGQRPRTLGAVLRPSGRAAPSPRTSTAPSRRARVLVRVRGHLLRLPSPPPRARPRARAAPRRGLPGTGFTQARMEPAAQGSISEGFLEARSPKGETSTPSSWSLVCSVGRLFSFL